MFREEIFESIDAIESDSLYTESCVLNEICSLCNKETECTQEGFIDGAKSIFSKFVGLIKSFIRKIRTVVETFIAKITGKKRKDVNSIMMDIHDNPKKTITTESCIITESFKDKIFAHRGSKSVRVKIPSGKDSAFAEALVDIPMDDVVCSFDNDTKTIRFKIFGSGKFSTVSASGSDNDTPMNIPKTKNPWSGSAKTALYLMTNPDEFEKLTRLVDLALMVIFNNDKNAESMLNKECSSTISHIFKQAEKLDVDSQVVSMKDLTKFQRLLSEQSTKMDKFVDIEKTDVSDMDKKTIKTLNELTNKLIRIQISMNMLTSALDEKSIINGNFVGSINNVALLDVFVNRCIECGIPPKYIGFNTWLVADESIRGDSEMFKPIWGQTRVVFFPPSKKIVYKVALSGAGISSNEAEVRTSALFEEMKRTDLIAPVVKAWGNSAVIALERIPNNGTKPSYDQLLKYTKEVNDVIKQYEEKNNVKINTKITDQHRDNVMYDERTGTFRSIDYGIAKRSY